MRRQIGLYSLVVVALVAVVIGLFVLDSPEIVVEIDSAAMLKRALSEDRCVIATRIAWSLQTDLLKLSLEQLSTKWRNEQLRDAIPIYTLDLTPPHPVFIRDWLAVSSNVSPNSLNGEGQVLCFRRGVIVCAFQGPGPKELNSEQSISQLEHEILEGLRPPALYKIRAMGKLRRGQALCSVFSGVSDG